MERRRYRIITHSPGYRVQVVEVQKHFWGAYSLQLVYYSYPLQAMRFGSGFAQLALGGEDTP